MAEPIDPFHNAEEYPIAPLEDDCKLLESLLDDCLKLEIGEEQFHNVEWLRSLASSASILAQQNDKEAANFLSQKLVRFIHSMPFQQSLPIARACGHYLSLTGIAEMHHQVRKSRIEGVKDFQSFEQIFGKLESKGITKEETYKAICEQSLEVVFTAHPTQIVRRTLQYKLAKIAALLEQHDRPDLTPNEKDGVNEDLRREVSSLWHTQEFRSKAPSPTDEARGGLHIVERSLWIAIPSYFRRLSAALKKHTGHDLPTNAKILSFGSWMGGDREGNPSLSAEVTRQVACLSQWIAADLYLREVDALRFELSMSKCNDCIWKMTNTIVQKTQMDIQDRGWDGDYGLSNFATYSSGNQVLGGIEMPEFQDTMPSVPHEAPSINSLARQSLKSNPANLHTESTPEVQVLTQASSRSVSSDQEVLSPSATSLQKSKQNATRTSFKSSNTKLDELLNPIQANYMHEGSHPYRLVLGEVHQKLANTKRRVECLLAGHIPEGAIANDYYESPDEFLEVISAIYESLCESGTKIVAYGRTLDLIRRINSFGMSLMKMDIRQDSNKHVDAITEILKYLEIGTYNEWDEAQRLEFLTNELSTNRPLISMDMPLTMSTKEILEFFLVAAELGSNSLGAYVISKPLSASDILLVHLFQREAAFVYSARCGDVPKLDKVLHVVPSFETLDGLSQASHIMESLLLNKWYANYLKTVQNNRQEVMVGFCESGKDACRLSAAWALYQCQEQLVDLCKKLEVKLILFYGRGGTMGRGGGAPMWLAIQSQPPGAINNCLRLTEQGEMIQTKFGIPAVAEAQLEICSTGMLFATLVPPVAPDDEGWLEMMNTLSSDSCDAYRSVIFSSKFDDYFKHVTPDSELATMSLTYETNGTTTKPIPWIFSWTQTRQVLPSWLGLGPALQAAIDAGKLEILQKMYQDWPFFHSTFDLIEMVLAKVDYRISATYDEVLVTDPEEKELGIKLKDSYELTVQHVLMVTGHTRLCEHNKLLTHLLSMRNPFLDPINILQSRILLALRASPFDKKLKDALMITVNGIAAGMRNTG